MTHAFRSAPITEFAFPLGNRPRGVGFLCADCAEPEAHKNHAHVRIPPANEGQQPEIPAEIIERAVQGSISLATPRIVRSVLVAAGYPALLQRERELTARVAELEETAMKFEARSERMVKLAERAESEAAAAKARIKGLEIECQILRGDMVQAVAKVHNDDLTYLRAAEAKIEELETEITELRNR